MIVTPNVGDSSAMLQAAVQASNFVELSVGDYRLDKPVMIPSGCELVGKGLSSRLRVDSYHDAIVSLPDCIRLYNSSPHLSDNPLAPTTHWSFRTLGRAALRVWNAPVDMGRWDLANPQRWGLVTGFAIDLHITRHVAPTGGAVMGMVSHKAIGDTYGANHPPSPWLITDPQQVGQQADKLQIALRLEDRTVKSFSFTLGPVPNAIEKIRFRIDLVIGSVKCFKDNVELVQSSGDSLAPGSKLIDNHNAAMFIGAVSAQGGSDGLISEHGCADVTFHAVLVWKVVDPPGILAYNPILWHPSATFVMIPLKTVKPVAGYPVFKWDGTGSGFGYLIPKHGNLGDQWSMPVQYRDFAIVNFTKNGHGILIQSALRIDVERISMQGGATVVRVAGGPLNNYPVYMDRIHGFGQADCVVTVQRSGPCTLSRITGEYPTRNVIRGDMGSQMYLRDIWHSPDGDRWVEDVLRFEACNSVDVERFNSNYEDNIGPRTAYIRMLGSGSRLRMKECSGHSQAEAKGYNVSGTLPELKVILENSFGVPDTLIDRE